MGMDDQLTLLNEQEMARWKKVRARGKFLFVTLRILILLVLAVPVAGALYLIDPLVLPGRQLHWAYYLAFSLAVCGVLGFGWGHGAWNEWETAYIDTLHMSPPLQYPYGQ